MASGLQVLDGVPENLRKQLAIAVRSIQWSYAIFWSISSRQPGVLEWGDGYYNGDIKTRKTVQAAELEADHLGLQRSEQLRELYESLSVAETNPLARRPSAALSPEDLTDTEWYYLVCMSFVFNIGQGLPGRTLAKNQIIWICDAHHADSKTFSRSLLAKSASIQTVVCFPHMRGVVELGATDPVAEDRDLIQHIKSTFLDNPFPKISEIPCYIPDGGRNDENMIETDLDLLVECEEEKFSSPNNSTSGFEDDQQAEESNMVEGVNGETSQEHGWQFMDDELSNCPRYSMDSSDCISRTYANPKKVVPVANAVRQNNEDYLQEQHASNQKKLNNFGLRGGDVHYQGVVSTLLKSSHMLLLGPFFRNDNRESSFASWKEERPRVAMPTSGKQQRLLKKMLLEVPRRHCNWVQESTCLPPSSLCPKASCLPPSSLCPQASCLPPSSLCAKASCLPPSSLCPKASCLPPSSLCTKASCLSPSSLCAKASCLPPSSLCAKASGLPPSSLCAKASGLPPSSLCAKAPSCLPPSNSSLCAKAPSSLCAKAPNTSARASSLCAKAPNTSARASSLCAKASNTSTSASCLHSPSIPPPPIATVPHLPKTSISIQETLSTFS